MKNILVVGILILTLVFLNFILTQSSNSFLQISFLIAFLGGVIAILSPCTFAIIPAFFAFALESKEELVKMTFLFFLGLSLVLVPLGFAASLAGQVLVSHRVQITFFAGLVMVFFGVLILFDITIPFFTFLSLKAPKTKNRYINTFLFGILFGTGFSPCAGPILGSILTLAAASGTALTGGLYLLIYAFGMVTPLFLLSYFYERFQLYNSKIINASFDIKFLGLKRRLYWTKLISGLIFISFGLAFIFFKGTAFLVNLGTKLNLLEPFFRYQDFVIKYFSKIPNEIGTLIVSVIVGFIIHEILNRKR